MRMLVIFNFVLLGSFLSQIITIRMSESSLKKKISQKKSINQSKNISKNLNLTDKEPRMIIYKEEFQFQRVQEVRKEINYINFTYEQISFLGKGASGRVVLAISNYDGTKKAVKQFYQEENDKFQRENCIMEKLNYSVIWSKSFGNKPRKIGNQIEMIDPCGEQPFTIAIYHYEESSFDASYLKFNEKIAPLYFYQVAKEILRCHKKSIVHEDMKPANILIKKMDLDDPYLQAQLIDWLAASFYIEGQKISSWPGEVYYRSPQKFLRFQYTGPAQNVWALGLIMFEYYLGFDTLNRTVISDPTLNLVPRMDQLTSLVGSEAVIALQEKYRSKSSFMIRYCQNLKNRNEVIPKKNLKEFLNSQNSARFTEELLQIFERMLHPDPELRMTISELLKTDFMRRAKEILSKNQKIRESK